MKQLVENYTFSPSSKTITLTDFTTIRLDRILLITDVTNNLVIYQFNNSALGGSVATNILTLDYNTTTGFSSSDALQIFYDSAAGDPIYDLPIVAGNVASGATDSGNPVKVGGKYNLSAPTLANGQRGDLQLDSAGNLKVNVSSAGSGGSTEITDGTNIASTLKSDGTAAGQNSLMVAGTFLEQTWSVTSVSALTGKDVSNYKWVSVHVVAQYTGSTPTITFQGSNDNSNWVSVQLHSPSANGGAGLGSSTTTTGIFAGPIQFRYFRLNFTGTYSSGTSTGVIEYYTNPSSSLMMEVGTYGFGSSSVGSSTATGSAVPANAFYIGGLSTASGNLLGVTISTLAGDGVAAANTINVANLPKIYNGTNWDLQRSATSAAATTGTGLLGAGALGIYNSSAPTVVSGNYERLQLDSSANLKINIAASSGSMAVSSNSATGSAVPANAFYLAGSNGGNLKGLGLDSSGYLILTGGANLDSDAYGSGYYLSSVYNLNNVYNGTTWDRMRSASQASVEVQYIEYTSMLLVWLGIRLASSNRAIGVAGRSGT
jgi:hypothetical protein